MHSRFRRLCQLQPVLRVHFCDSGASRHNHKKFSPSSCVGRVAQSHTALRAISRLPASANAVRTASVTFPLTPALSLGERENPPLAFSAPSAVSARRTSRTTEPAAGCSLSPWERVRVRGIGLLFDTATRTIPEIVELRESSGIAGGFP